MELGNLPIVSDVHIDGLVKSFGSTRAGFSENLGRFDLSAWLSPYLGLALDEPQLNAKQGAFMAPVRLRRR